MKNPVLERLQRYGLQPRKDLGQHFLVDGNVLDRIQDAIAPAAGDCIVEFGAGLGVLTERLVQAGAAVVAIELDDALVDVLRRELGSLPGLRIVHADLARVDVGALADEAGAERVKLAGNLPYQLTSRVLFGVLDLDTRCERAVFMVQREVAERLVAPPGTRDYGITSVLLQARHRVDMLARVRAGCFVPPPRVESAVIQVEPRQDPRVPAAAMPGLVRLVKNVFNERRKTLRNTLRKFYGLQAEDVAACAERSGIDLARRPETLTVEEFVRLLRVLPEPQRQVGG